MFISFFLSISFFSFPSAPGVEKGDSLPFSFIAESASELKESNQEFQGKFVAAVIKALADANGNARIGEMWKTSGMSWDQFMDKAAVDSFVEKNVSILVPLVLARIKVTFPKGF